MDIYKCPLFCPGGTQGQKNVIFRLLPLCFGCFFWKKIFVTELFFRKNPDTFLSPKYMDSLVTFGDKKVSEIFRCDSCDYKTSVKSNYNKHLLTRRHTLVTTGDEKVSDTHICCYCHKAYSSRNGLWLHKKKHNLLNDIEMNENKIVTSSITPTMEPIDMFHTFLQESNDFKKMMFEEFKEMMAKQNQMMMDQNKTIMEIASKPQNNTQINNNNNNNNSNTQINNKQKFNLNFFLNETCKDAMNITDFVNSLQIQFSDLENVGELGYAEGISRIFMKGLKALDICKRPIHCTDLKREIVHIKNNNQWEKEISLLQKAIKIITNNNINKITEWKNAHPGCTDGENKLNDKYCRIMYESMGPIDEEQEQKDFSKIIRNIAKCTLVDKSGSE